MPTTCVIGLLWGDEGKGKIIDLFGADADVVARYGGGHNAGHTLIHGGERLVLHLIPSAIRHPGVVNVIGNGVVVDPLHLRQEIEKVRAAGIEIELGKNFLISAGAHLILQAHQAQDQVAETSRGSDKIGTTGRGIGPAYADRAARVGLRVGDLLRPERLVSRVERLCAHKNPMLGAVDLTEVDSAGVVETLREIGEWLAPGICDAGRYLREAHASGKRILFEGAQGVLLDVDHGTYPFVTSSSSSTGGIATGTGLPPQVVGEVCGVVKAYATRVGEGPFPTELQGDLADRIREAGREFGSTTGRPRRVGWFDAVATRYAVAVSGATEISLTMLDVLAGFGDISMAVAYDTSEGRTDVFPVYDLDDKIEPVFETFAGFEGDLTTMRTFEELPEAAQRYVLAIEKQVGVPVRTISVGPARDQVIRR